jgi:hypothetical protein
MGRRSLAETFYEESNIENTYLYDWVVIYDFHKTKPNRNFYTNLKRLREVVPDAWMEQYSVFKTRDFKGALTAWKLAKHYGAETALYKVEEVNPDDPGSLKAITELYLEPHQAWLVMKAVRKRLEDVNTWDPDFEILVNVLSRFYSLLMHDDNPLDIVRVTFYTRYLLESEVEPQPIKGAWIEECEVDQVREAVQLHLMSKSEGEVKEYLLRSLEDSLSRKPQYRVSYL